VEICGFTEVQQYTATDLLLSAAGSSESRSDQKDDVMWVQLTKNMNENHNNN